MAGEHYARITIQAALSRNDDKRSSQTISLSFRLAGQLHTFSRGGDPGQFTVPDPNDAIGEDYVRQTVKNVIALLRGRIGIQGLPYVVSEPREAGTIQEPVGNTGATLPVPLVEFDITATDYGKQYNLDFSYYAPSTPTGWFITGQR
jgi:hypothetical protein